MSAAVASAAAPATGAAFQGANSVYTDNGKPQEVRLSNIVAARGLFFFLWERV